jgi:hypothetical protein
VGEVEVEVVHDGVVAVFVIFDEELVGEDAFGGGVAIVLSVELGDAEAPVEVLGLNGVGEALDVEDLLVGNDLVGGVVVGGG